MVYRKVDSGYGRANNALDRSEDSGSVFSPPSFRFAVGTDWRHLTNSVLDRAHDPGLVLRCVLRQARGQQGGSLGLSLSCAQLISPWAHGLPDMGSTWLDPV